MNRSGLGVFNLTDRIRRLAYIESQSIKHLAGWFPAIRKYEIRHAIGYHVWTHAEHATWFRERLGFLRGGKSSVSLEPSLLQFVNLVQHAPNEYAFLRGLYHILKKDLLELCRLTLAECDPSANAYDIRVLRRVIPELEEQVSWSDGVLASDPDPDTSIAWCVSLRSHMDRIGGILAANQHGRITAKPAGYREFELPDRLLFDERIADAPLLSHDEKTKLPYEEARLEQFRIFFNEIYAAGMLASVLYDSFEHDMPWEFVHDMARHFWDECRHSEFGAIRLKELGSEPDRCNQELYLNARSMPLLHRICYLTLVLEPYYMPRKKPRFKEYETAGDDRSQLFADHDWSDEINHVRLGKEWLKRLLDEDARSVDQLREETHELLGQMASDTQALSPF